MRRLSLPYFLSSEVIICLQLIFQIWIKLCRYFKLQLLPPFAEFSLFYGICDIAFWLTLVCRFVSFFSLFLMRTCDPSPLNTPPFQKKKKPQLNTKNECPSLVPLSQYRHLIHRQRCVQLSKIKKKRAKIIHVTWL